MKFQVKIDIALAALNKNLTDHITELKEANEVWTERVIEELKKLQNAVTRDGLRASNKALSDLFYQKPKDNRAEYSTYIGALNKAQESDQHVIELDEHDYDRIFNDNFEWRVLSASTNSMYKKGI